LLGSADLSLVHIEDTMRNLPNAGWGAIAVSVAGLAAVSSCNDEATAPSLPVTFEATLSGAEERPNPTGSAATGTATFSYDEVANTFSYTITVAGLNNAVASHIHVARQGVNGSIAVDFFPGTSPPTGTLNGTLVTGTITSSSMTATSPITFPSLLPLMRTGDVYVNVHTQAFAGGEIRGQIKPK
jgi:CHRD domain